MVSPKLTSSPTNSSKSAYPPKDITDANTFRAYGTMFGAASFSVLSLTILESK
jgi:hypothetical protein